MKRANTNFDWNNEFEINININLDARQTCFILAVRHL
jgi:hypothetical protein